jgi:NADPH:quinone reductase-like Zn-dependent oxidoreductase
VAALGGAGDDDGLAVGASVAVAFRVFCGRCVYCLRGREEACLADPRGATAPVAMGVTRAGGYAEYVLAPRRNCMPLPAGLSAAEACTAVIDGATAWHLVERARVAAGDHVLVVGASGGVGTFAVQMARARGRPWQRWRGGRKRRGVWRS